MFKDLIVWQKAMELVKAVYALSKAFPADERYALTSVIFLRYPSSLNHLCPKSVACLALCLKSMEHSAVRLRLHLRLTIVRLRLLTMTKLRQGLLEGAKGLTLHPSRGLPKRGQRVYPLAAKGQPKRCQRVNPRRTGGSESAFRRLGCGVKWTAKG